MLKDNLDKELVFLGNLIIERLKRQIKINKLIATGELEDSFIAKVDDTTLNIYSSEAYAGAMDGGINNKGRMNKAFINNMTRWVKSKGIQPRKFVTKKGKSVFTGQYKSSSENNLRQMSFLFARSISKKGVIKRYGYKGSGFMKQAYESVSKKIGDDLLNAYILDLENELVMMINKK